MRISRLRILERIPERFTILVQFLSRTGICLRAFATSVQGLFARSRLSEAKVEIGAFDAHSIFILIIFFKDIHHFTLYTLYYDKENAILLKLERSPRCKL